MFGSTFAGRPVRIADQLDSLKFVTNYDNIAPKLLFHLSIFLLPNVPFDPNYTALIFYQFQKDGTPTSEFRLLGGLNEAKQSAIFKINSGISDSTTNQPTIQSNEGDIDMDTTDMDNSSVNSTSSMSLVIGISIEPNNIALPQLEQLKLQHTQKALPAPIKPEGKLSTADIPLTKDQIESISGKIINNAYNFLSSFVDDNNNVSISKFDLWWSRFKVKMANDPSFLDNLT
ncbi:hypothetical protein CANARDRAFT_196267 [[Candida] arabinofermentans NRRL YB-2248]|uniref:Hikeshi-like domain-containing protein n=1 Tax=[Candida] arabinofermentans NRRL YB-2248 TaxID=983967 RepID=A0A1E4T4Q9_9ASCO|nr:hypothetical protein CANARDRAFT_196267 [[Candida] arabinofermentans NRRL YB-2248]